MNDQEIRNLIIEILDGDTEKYSLLVKEYQDSIYRLAVRFCRDKDSAKDASQEIFIRAYENLASFNMKSSFFTWIYRIGTNYLLNQIKKEKHLKNMISDNYDYSLIESTENPEKIAIKKETNERILEMLDKETSPGEKMSIVLKYNEGLKIREIADILKVSQGTVKKNLHRGLKKISNKFGEIL